MLKDELRKLIELQEIDKKIYALKEEAKKIPLEIKSIEEEFALKKEKFNSLEEEKKNLKIKQKDKELELESRGEQIKKHQAQLYQIKTNKEYQAKLQEIESLKADCSVIEEEVIKLMEEIEQIEKSINEEREKLSKEEDEAGKKIEELKGNLKELEEQIKILESQRAAKVVHIDKSLLSDYQRLLEAKSGLALAEVRDFICQGCNMSIPPQVVNEIKMYKGTVHCGFCARILYIPEDLE